MCEGSNGSIEGKGALCSSCVAACDPAKGQAVSHGIAAQTVAAMDAARYFTGCVQTDDDVTLSVQDVCVRVNGQAAHGVMQSRLARGGEEGAFLLP